MPRRALTTLSNNEQNKRADRELSPATRGEIIGRMKAGQNGVEVGAEMGLKPDTVRKTYRMAKQRQHQESLPRSGAPSKHDARDDRRILRFIRQNTALEWNEVMKLLHVDFSKRTVQRILAKYHITKWRAKKRPMLTPELATERLSFA